MKSRPIRSVDAPDAPLEDVATFAAETRARAEKLRDDAQKALRDDPTGETAILLGALARVAGRVEERCRAVLEGETETPRPAAAPEPEEPRRRMHHHELSAPAMVALDMIAQGADRTEAEAYLRNHFGAEDARRILDELYSSAA